MTGSRGPRAFVGLLALAIVVVAGSVPPGAGAWSGGGSGDCPTVLPLKQVTTGMTGTALSVTHGRTLSTLGVQVLGILRDGVGPGRDIIVVDLSGSAVTASGGLWAGASGSPVYVHSGGKDKLVGAIAYGLAGGGSTLAGVTPAEDMEDLLALGADAVSAPALVKVPTALAARMATASGLSITQTGALSRLRTPLSASGLTDRGLQQMRRAIDRQGLPFIPYAGSSVSNNPTNPPGQVRAGDSFAAAMSVGDITVAGIGTTTFVCDGRAVAFGHPFNWTGETTMSARAADTITIVKDPVYGSYKLANVAESVGTVTQDRLAGLVADLGHGPVGSPVTSTVTDLDTGRSRSGRSDAIFPDFLPFLSFEHLFQNVDVTIDRIGAGSSEIAYTIRGTRDRGATWRLTRSSRYASRDDISFESVVEVASTAEVLQAFDGENVQVTSVGVPKLDVKRAFEQYTITGLLVWNGHRYASPDFVSAKPGHRVRLRAVLTPVHTTGTKTVDLALRVPKNAKRNGYIQVLGGGSISADVPCFIVEDECSGGGGKSFDKVLRAFRNQPPGDAVVARLRLGGGGRLRSQMWKRQEAVVRGGKAIGFLLIR